MNKLAVAAFVAVVVVAAAGFYSQVGIPKGEQVTKVTWRRAGGFIALSESLVIYSNGSASYRSNRFGDSAPSLTEEEVKALLQILGEASFFTLDGAYPARPGAADYFSYSLTVHTRSGAKTVEWVDASVSEKTIPEGLEKLQRHILAIVERIRVGEGDKTAIEIAKAFILQAPTFKYDGVPETLNVMGVKIRESFPPQYVVTLTFDSRHAGYGDRTGQVLAQVITPHTAVVTVVRDSVVSAILDGQWDELRQEPIPMERQQGTISGRVTIGPLCPVEPCPDPQPHIYSSREVILQPEAGDPVRVRLSSDGSFQTRVNAGTYIVNLTDCVFLGCSSALPKTVTVEPNKVTRVDISIDTGIR